MSIGISNWAQCVREVHAYSQGQRDTDSPPCLGADDFDLDSELELYDNNNTEAEQNLRIQVPFFDQQRLRFLEIYPIIKEEDVIIWDIPPTPTNFISTPNLFNTQNAIEEYYTRARRANTEPSEFLEKYYQFALPPRIGQPLTVHNYYLYKARVNCDRNGVCIPKMDSVCQAELYNQLHERYINRCDRSRGLPTSPLSPLLTPVFNPETQSYEASI